MFGSRRLRLCELFGIPLYLDSSLLILLVIYALNGGSLFFNLIGAALMFASISEHELGLALTARSFGYETNDITLSLLGGCASLISLPRKASQEFLTAIAGPAVSFLIAVVAFTGIGMIRKESVWGVVLYEITNGMFGNPSFTGHISSQMSWLVKLLFHVGMMNIMLGAFNMLPGFPMDGGRVFRSVMRSFMDRTRATYVAMIVGRVFAVLLALHGLHRILYQGNWGFITLLIAWMIWQEGYREYRQALIEEEWGGRWNYSAKISPPPYGGDEDETEIRRDR